MQRYGFLCLESTIDPRPDAVVIVYHSADCTFEHGFEILKHGERLFSKA